MARLTLYHGTAHDFEAFDPRFTLRGSEPNSALGIHLAESPALAAEYAALASRDVHGGRPRVLVVEAEISKVAVVSSREEFMGRPQDVFNHDLMRERSEFVSARLELQAKGFDAVAGDCLGDDLDGCWVIFDPAGLRIVGEITIKDAQSMDSGEIPAGIDYETVTLFEETTEESFLL